MVYIKQNEEYWHDNVYNKISQNKNQNEYPINNLTILKTDTKLIFE